VGVSVSICKNVDFCVIFCLCCMRRMQAVLAQPVLLRKPRPPKNSVFDSVSRSCTRNAKQSAADSQLDNPAIASADNCQEQAAPRKPCHSPLASHNGEKLRHFNSLHLSSKVDRDVKLKSRTHVPDSLPARSYKQKKSHVLPAPVDDEDVKKFYQPPKFTLRDFIVQFSANEDVPVGDVAKSLYSPLTYCRLQKVIEERCRPRNTHLSTQQLKLPDDLPEVRQRVPHKQLLIEMTAVIKEHLSKVVC